jgi:lysophospholipase L1-like esterase
MLPADMTRENTCCFTGHRHIPEERTDEIKAGLLKIVKILSAAVLVSSFVLGAAEPQIKVALTGSSACQTYKSTDPNLIFGWGEVIGKYFTSNVKILNFAVSGYSTVSFRTKGKWDQTIKAKPDYVFITLGANDTPGKKFATKADSTYKDNLRRYAAEAQKIGAKVIFVTINQSLSLNRQTGKAVFFKHGPWRKDRAPYSKAMREVAAELKLPCLELAENQRKIYEAMGEEEAGKLYRYNPKTQKIDPSHTNKAGAELLAKIIITELRKSSSDLKKYTIDPKLVYPAKKK